MQTAYTREPSKQGHGAGRREHRSVIRPRRRAAPGSTDDRPQARAGCPAGVEPAHAWFTARPLAVRDRTQRKVWESNPPNLSGPQLSRLSRPTASRLPSVPVIPGGFAPPTFSMSPRCPGLLDDGTSSTPSRGRTCNASFEARDDVRFTIGARAEGKGVEPSSPRGEPTFQIGPANRIRLPSVGVDPLGIEPRFPACRAGVVPLDHEPARVDRRGLEPRFLACETSVFPLDEQPALRQRSARDLNPARRPTKAVCRPQHLQTVE